MRDDGRMVVPLESNKVRSAPLDDGSFVSKLKTLQVKQRVFVFGDRNEGGNALAG